VLNMAQGVNSQPLGHDRAFRRYWLFNSLPGLFVEDNEQHPGVCRQTPTPYNPQSNPDLTDALVEVLRVQAKKNMSETIAEKDDKSNSDKENDGSESPAKQAKGTPSKKLLQTLNHNQPSHQVKTEKCSVLSPDGAESELKMDINLSGDVKLETDGEALVMDDDRSPMPDIFGLCTANPRNCPVHSERRDRHKWFFFHSVEDLNSLFMSLNSRGSREKELKSALECYRTTVEASMKACPVYKLDPSQEPDLDQSIRKSQRNLTTKKDGDANLNFPPGTPIDEILQATLRDMVLETEEKIHMGMLGSLRLEDREAWRRAIVEGSYLRESELDFGGRKRISLLRMEVGQEVNGEQDTEELLSETDKARKIREHTEEKLRRRKEEEAAGSEGGDSDEDDSENKVGEQVTDNALRTPIERWEVSLMASTNLSQEIPSGDWYCDRCKPKEKPKSPRKNRQIYKDVSDDEGDSGEESDVDGHSEEVNQDLCYVCEKPGTLICCDTCPLAFHQECADLRKIPRGSWSCQHCQGNAPVRGKESPPEKKKNSKDTNKENNKSNKENRAKKETKNAKENKSNKKTPKSTDKMSKSTSKSKKATTPSEKKRRSEGDTSRVSKKLKVDDFECGWTPPKRSTGRRSLVDEDSVLNCSALETILDELQRQPSSWPFLKPVSKKVVPDYYEIVKKPMDIGRVREKLNSMKYATDDEFIADVMLVFQNCQQYNMEETEEYKCGTVLSNLFMKRIRELGLSYEGDVKKEAKKKR
ncbi:Bromodomain adjacent to zinc finger domain protein 1A-like 1, partial [Homarus americanus]